MKLSNLLPSLLPVLMMLVTAISAPVQHALASVATSHPVWSSVFLAIGFVVNHWLPAPGSQPAALASSAR